VLVIYFVIIGLGGTIAVGCAEKSSFILSSFGSIQHLMMTFKDRTVEFNSVAETVRSRSHASPVPKKSAKSIQKSQFMLAASQIGKEIFEASEKLNKLTKLAKKRSLFDDPAVEIEELTFILKQDIQRLNGQIASLRESKARGNNKQNEAHSDTVIGYLNSKLANTTKDFKEILQVRTENLKTQQERRQKFTGASAVSSGSTPTRTTSEPSIFKSNVDDLPESPARTHDAVVLHMPMVLQQEEYTSSRLNAVESIERTIGELQGVFSQLGALIADQGNMIERIDSNIETSMVHVDKSHDALLKHLYKISSNRWLILKLFFVLILFVIIFVVFFV